MPSFSSPGASFGGAFAGGLAQVLGQKRLRDDQGRQRQIDNTWKSMQFLLDSGQVNDVADLQPHFDTLTNLGAFGDPKKQKRGQPAPQDNVVKVLGHVLGSNQGAMPPSASPSWQSAMASPQAGQTPAGTPPPSIAAPPAPTVGATPSPTGTVEDDAAGGYSTPGIAPSAPAAPPPIAGTPLAPVSTVKPATPPHRMLNGIPLLSPDEALANKVGREGTVTMAKIELARNRILPALKAVDPSATLDDALAAVGVRLPTSTFHNQSVAGEVMNADGTTTPAFGIFNGRFYVDYQTGQPLENFIPRTTTGSRSLGTAVEVAARQLFGKPAAQLNPQQMAQAQELATDQAGAKADVTARGRVTGAGQAAMDVPATAETALKTPGMAIGDTNAQFAGQQPATQEQATTQRTISLMTESLDHIKELVEILPSESELGGLAPGAWIESQKRTPRGRAKFARLESAVGNIITTLNRSINSNVGAQSDQDILRAYQTVVDIQTGLLSPTKGDTYEAALARLDETMNALKAKAGSMPGVLVKSGGTPAPKANTGTTPPPAADAPAAAPAAAPAGAVDPNTRVPGLVRDTAGALHWVN